MRVLSAVIVALLLANSLWASSNNPRSRSRIEELFIWRVSDTLGLSPEVEEKFKSEFKRLSQKKVKAVHEAESLVEQMGKTTDSARLQSLLRDYRSAIEDQNRVLIEEMDTFESLFGKEKFARYLVLKRELTQKLKDFVTSPSKGESGKSRKLSDPKIIQDEGR